MRVSGAEHRSTGRGGLSPADAGFQCQDVARFQDLRLGSLPRKEDTAADLQPVH